MASTRILEEDLVQAVFDVLSDEDELVTMMKAMKSTPSWVLQLDDTASGPDGSKPRQAR